MEKLVIVGAGALARQTMQWIEDINKRTPIILVVGVLSVGYEDEVAVCDNIIGELCSYIPQENESFIIAIKEPIAKKRAAEILDSKHVTYINVIHPSASIADCNKIGVGNIIFPNAKISVNTFIGNHTTILFSGMGHDTLIEDYVTIESGCDITGGVHLLEGCHVCTDSVIVPHKCVGKWSTIFPGSVVIRDVKDNLSVGGNPAKKLNS